MDWRVISQVIWWLVATPRNGREEQEDVAYPEDDSAFENFSPVLFSTSLREMIACHWVDWLIAIMATFVLFNFAV